MPGDVTQLTITPSWAAELDPDELEEQIAIVNFKLGQSSPGTPDADALQGNLGVLMADKQRRGKAAAAQGRKQERQKVEKQIVKVGAQMMLLGGPVLGWLGAGPIASTFLFEFGYGFGEGIEEQPADRKEALQKRFYDLHYKWGGWGDKWDFTKGYLLGIVEGIWGEIRGIGEFFVMLYKINQKINDWLVSAGVSLFAN